MIGESVKRVKVEKAMLVTGIRFLGVRTAEYDATVRLFRDVMDLRPTTTQDGQQTGSTLSDGTTIEIYSPDNKFHRFFTTGPVVGFQVADFDQAHARMSAAGVEFISPPQREGPVSLSHFRGPDGTIYEIVGPTRNE